MPVLPERGVALTVAAMLVWALPAVAAGPDTAAAVSCNPPVRLDVDGAALSATLAGLAGAHDFELVFPDSMERNVTLRDELALDDLLERLTDGISTMFIYADEPACDGRRIVKLVIYPEGERGDMARDAGNKVRTPPLAGRYFHVEDMDSYVLAVLRKERSAELFRLTPEQRVEFRMARQRLRQEMKGQGGNRALRTSQRERRAAAIRADRAPGKVSGSDGGMPDPAAN